MFSTRELSARVVPKLNRAMAATCRRARGWYQQATRPRVVHFPGIVVPLFMHRYTVVLRVEGWGVATFAVWAPAPVEAVRSAQEWAAYRFHFPGADQLIRAQGGSWFRPTVEHVQTFRGWQVPLISECPWLLAVPLGA
ncbi:hypothetical protein [Kitasatospora sp. NPDC088548]|uniref:hypothetical protein n=1 Tax=Kitasatospora sp. NPDC088548 TaxID=3364075 RepID=UPI00381F7CF5